MSCDELRRGLVEVDGQCCSALGVEKGTKYDQRSSNSFDSNPETSACLIRTLR